MNEILAGRPEGRGNPTAPESNTTTIVMAVVLVGVIYLGREVLMPIALAVLMSFVLAPLVGFLQRIYVPRVAAVFLVVLVAFSGVFALGGLMVSQVNQLAGDLPSYQWTLREKIQALRGAAAGSSTLERASEVLQDLGKELERPRGAARPATPAGGDTSARDTPIPVEVHQPDPGALQTLAALVAPLIYPLTTTGIVVIFVIFILMQQQDLRSRLVRLAGSHDLQRTTAAMDEAGQRLSRLFLMQLLLNAGFGLVIGIGLWVIGVPSAPLWGMLAMILRFVPYIGAIISAIFPLVLAAAVGQGWSMLLWTAALFLITEPIVGHVLEPLIYGHSSGLSPVAVVASATFWTWLWGPIGLILATPLTICLVVLGRHVERLKFLEVMLGSEPALTPEQQLYQRMLAGDPIEAAEQAQEFLEDKPLIEYYETVLMGGLRLAQADAERDSLDRDRMQRIRDVVAEIVDDLDAHEGEPEAAPESQEEGPLARLKKVEAAACEDAAGLRPERWRTDAAVLCVPGGGLLDEAIAMALAQLIRRRGIGARAAEADALSMAKLFALDTKDAALVCLCYLENATPAQVRYAARRIRRKAPEAHVLVSLFGESDHIAGAEAPHLYAGVELVTGSLRNAVERIGEIAWRTPAEQPQSDIPLPPAVRIA
ncbi:MAG: AI-2E family transporter [Xanthobacteraceae bacterium]